MSDTQSGEPAAMLRELGALDLDMAPDGPGIYAWYAQLGLTDEDWRPQLRDGIDLAPSFLIKALADYARVHQARPIHLRGEGEYRLHWLGSLRRASIADQDLASKITDVEARLSDLVTEPSARQLLIGLIRAATPIFASPLYIGVATNLRARLAAHMTTYENARATIRSEPSSAVRMQLGGRSFGERLAASGLHLQHLRCWVLPANFISSESSDDNQGQAARDVAETVEWILQRIFLPVLGRL